MPVHSTVKGMSSLATDFTVYDNVNSPTNGNRHIHRINNMKYRQRKEIQKNIIKIQ